MSRAAVVGAILRVGFKEAIAYRAELFVWILSTTMPLVMLALFSAVARDAPLGPYGEHEFLAYFLATFIVRQVTGSWAAWQINVDVRQGTLATKLLRPVHPLLTYGLETLASIPVRFALAVPVALVALLVLARDRLTTNPWLWLCLPVSLLGAWLITLLINFAVGCLAFFVDSSARVMDIYLAAYFVFSGYLIPVDLFPARFKGALDLLPFRYQIGLPVDILTARYDLSPSAVLGPLALQWLWVAIVGGLATVSWRRGIKHFGAFGG